MSTTLHLPPTAVHLSIDMQRVFADPTEWRIPDFHSIVPNIGAIAAAMPGRSLFTRFVTPHTAEAAHGHWQHYYRRWHQFTGAVMPPELVEIVGELAAFATPETWVDKLTYSAFDAPAFAERLAALAADTLVFTGVETDVCVLATLMAAVDRGYRVVAVSDALTSSSPEGHRATLEHVLPRMPDQIEIVDTRAVLDALQRLHTAAT